jgi:hypothetical protein
MTEELKIIMETIGQLGQAGKEAFIWWLVVKYVLHYVTVVFVIGCFGFVVLRITKATKDYQDECKLVEELAQKVGVYRGYGITADNIREMQDWIRSK